VIGEAGGSGRNGFVNGAQGGTGEFLLLFLLSTNEEMILMIGTDYFSMCFGEHIPDEVDLVLIDMCTSNEWELTNIFSDQR
jgi:hypothetical protein